MSVYFQRLLRQSGVLLPQPSVPIVSVAPPPASARIAPPVPFASDLVEVHEEHETPPASTPLPSANRVEAVPLSSLRARSETREPPSSTSRSLSPASDPISERRVIQKTDTIELETVAIGSSSPGAQPAPRAPSSSTTTPQSSDPAAASAGPAPSSELPAEVMQAVMKWIAAGSAPANPPVAVAREISEFSEKPASRSPAAPVPAPPLAPREAPKIPDRMIQIVEEHFEEAVASNRSDFRDAAAAAAQPAPAFVSPPESPVRVSIGSIQVRIDAPAPAPSRVVRPPTPSRPAASATPRSSGISQLRRHYIIPH